MKKYIILLFVAGVLIGCKNTVEEKKEAVLKELNILEKVAYAHGLKQWGNVNEIQFSFNVDRDTSHFERNWTWKVKSNEVVLKTAQDTINYKRAAVDSTTTRADQGFINDKYWLLAPFNLLWDQKSFTYEHHEVSEAPISKQQLQKLTIVYKNEGGYTPGDAYDFYFGNDFIVKEWVFRKSNAEEASLTTTWEDYEDYNGLKIARTHNRDNGNWKLYFTNISVK